MVTTPSKKPASNVFIRQLHSLLQMLYHPSQPQQSLFGLMRAYFQQDESALAELQQTEQRWRQARAEKDPALSDYR
ncbi:MAG: hypothetical protein JJU30_10010, partial [Alkalimonas sp.]|nr:hypothetical protein [Alkalimonas sp.]